MRRDLKNNVLVSPGAQQALSGTTNVTGASVDGKGYDSVTHVACFSTIAASSLAATLKIEESDDNSNWTEVTEANDLIVTSDLNPAFDQDSDDSCASVGYVGNKRYSRPVLDVTANDGTDVVAIVSLRSHAHGQPVEGN